MPPAKMRGDGRMAKNPKKTLLRLLSYLKPYTPTLIAVMLCVFATAFASITGSTALGDLVDEFILPMVASDVSLMPDYTTDTLRRREGGYCSICRPMMLAVVSATFWSTLVICKPDSRLSRISPPTISPSARIGATIWAE